MEAHHHGEMSQVEFHNVLGSINNNPENLISGLQICLFANDTKIYRQAEGIEDYRRLQEDLDTLVD